MFDRVKFVVGFAGAYRRSRHAGEEHVSALDSAARDMMLRRMGGAPPPGSIVPEPFAQLWLNPDPAFALADGSWFGDGSFDITPPHLHLLRQMRFGWDGAERGAPMLDPQRPYGRTGLLPQLGQTFTVGTSDPGRELAGRHVEMMFVLARALTHGTLAPGSYPLGNISADDVRHAMQGYRTLSDGALSDDDLGLDADGNATITDDHLKLLRAIDIRWPSNSECEDRLAAGEYPAATADAKRPYGDLTYIEADMVRVLGELPPGPDDERLQRLHWQMLVAMQVFAEHADLTPGVYQLYAD